MSANDDSTICSIDDKKIVSAEIPGVAIVHRLVFYKGMGRIKGSFVRVGDSDEPMSEYEVYSYEAYRKHIRDDARAVPEIPIDSLNKTDIENYIQLCKKERRNLSDNVSNAEILDLMGITHSGIPTIAGILSFSKYPRVFATILHYCGQNSRQRDGGSRIFWRKIYRQRKTDGDNFPNA